MGEAMCLGSWVNHLVNHVKYQRIASENSYYLQRCSRTPEQNLHCESIYLRIEQQKSKPKNNFSCGASHAGKPGWKFPHQDTHPGWALNTGLSAIHCEHTHKAGETDSIQFAASKPFISQLEPQEPHHHDLRLYGEDHPCDLRYSHHSLRSHRSFEHY